MYNVQSLPASTQVSFKSKSAKTITCIKNTTDTFNGKTAKKIANIGLIAGAAILLKGASEGMGMRLPLITFVGKKVDDDTYYMAEGGNYKNGVLSYSKSYTNSNKKSVDDIKEHALRETVYNTKTGEIRQMISFPDDRAVKIIDRSPDGKYVFTHYDRANGNKIEYHGYDKNFKKVDTEEQCIKFIDKEGNVLETFTGEEIEAALKLDYRHCDQDYAALGALNVKCFGIGNVTLNLLDSMRFQVRHAKNYKVE